MTCPFRPVPSFWGPERPDIGLTDPENPPGGPLLGLARHLFGDLKHGWVEIGVEKIHEHAASHLKDLESEESRMKCKQLMEAVSYLQADGLVKKMVKSLVSEIAKLKVNRIEPVKRFGELVTFDVFALVCFTRGMT